MFEASASAFSHCVCAGRQTCSPVWKCARRSVLRYYAPRPAQFIARRRSGPQRDQTAPLLGAVCSPAFRVNFPLAILIGRRGCASAGIGDRQSAEQPQLIGAWRRIDASGGDPARRGAEVPGDGKVGRRDAHPRLPWSPAPDRRYGAGLTVRATAPAAISRIAVPAGECDDVDSSALPEQVTRDVVASSFQSAGQRCSALRVLFVQDDVADGMVAMIAGAMQALVVGDPRALSTDVGPVIDEEAKAALDAHAAAMDAGAKLIARLELPKAAAKGSFVAPAIYENVSMPN